MLSDVDYIKFAFVTRKKMDDNTKHMLLATHTSNTKKWAQQQNITIDSLWSNIKYITELVNTHDPDSDTSEYILLKDFNKSAFRLYKKDMAEEEEGEAEQEEGEAN